LVKNTKYVCISPSARQDRFNVAPALITTPWRRMEEWRCFHAFFSLY
jgi:hypothetical protein